MNHTWNRRPLTTTVVLCLAIALAWSNAAAQTMTFVIDGQDKSVYRYGAAGAPPTSFQLVVGNDNGHGVAFHGASVYVLDATDRQVYRYSLSGSFQAVSRPLRQAAGASLSTPGALAIDGDALWVVDRGRLKLFRYSLAAAFWAGGPLNAAQEIPLVAANARAEGLAIDAVHLYVLDLTRKQFFRYRRDGTGAVDMSGILRRRAGGSLGAPYGAALDGDSMFVVDASRDAIFSYDVGSLFSGSAPMNALTEVALDPANGDARDLAVVTANVLQVFEESDSSLQPGPSCTDVANWIAVDSPFDPNGLNLGTSQVSSADVDEGAVTGADIRSELYGGRLVSFNLTSAEGRTLCSFVSTWDPPMKSRWLVETPSLTPIDDTSVAADPCDNGWEGAFSECASRAAAELAASEADVPKQVTSDGRLDLPDYTLDDEGQQP